MDKKIKLKLNTKQTGIGTFFLIHFILAAFNNNM